MKLLKIRPILWTDKSSETINFYVDRLGFTCVEQNDDWGWAALHRDDVEIMVAKPNAHTPFIKPNFTGSLYINVDDVDDLWNDTKDKVSICYAIETFEWNMREFAIYDNNGYIIQFGENIRISKR